MMNRRKCMLGSIYKLIIEDGVNRVPVLNWTRKGKQ